MLQFVERKQLVISSLLHLKVWCRVLQRPYCTGFCTGKLSWVCKKKLFPIFIWNMNSALHSWPVTELFQKHAFSPPKQHVLNYYGPSCNADFLIFDRHELLQGGESSGGEGDLTQKIWTEICSFPNPLFFLTFLPKEIKTRKNFKSFYLEKKTWCLFEFLECKSWIKSHLMFVYNFTVFYVMVKNTPLRAENRFVITYNRPR